MCLEAQEQGAQLVGVVKLRFSREVGSLQTKLSSSRKEANSVDIPIGPRPASPLSPQREEGDAQRRGGEGRGSWNERYPLNPAVPPNVL